MHMRLKSFLILLVTVMIVTFALSAEALEYLTGPTGVLRYDKSKAYDGYTLISPSVNCNTTYLLDMEGNIVHQWDCEYAPGLYAELLPNGNLLRGGRIKEIPVGIGGVAGIVQEITWDGKVIWEFAFNNKTQIQHHCFKRLPNGNTLVLGWEKKSAKEAKAKGRDPRSIPSKPIEGKGVYTDSFWPDFCVEVNKTGKIVWEWHAWDHIGTGPDQLDINFHLPEPVGSMYPNFDWTHFNTVDYIPETDQIILNSRNFSEFYLINHKTGKIEYRWGNPSSHGKGVRPSWYNDGSQRVFGSHHAHYIGNGKILLFDNGSERPQGNRSRVVIVDIKSGKEDWSYEAKDANSFFSYRQGAAQMLPNGNVMITSSNHGHLIEVTADKKIAWEFVSPLFAGEAKCVVTDEKDSTSHNFNTNSMHRAYRYGRDFPGLQGKDLSVKRPLADGCPLFYKVYKKGASFEGSFEKIDEGNKNEGDEELMMPAY